IMETINSEATLDWNSLPVETKLDILDYLSVPHLLNASEANKGFNELTHTSPLVERVTKAKVYKETLRKVLDSITPSSLRSDHELVSKLAKIEPKKLEELAKKHFSNEPATLGMIYAQIAVAQKEHDLDFATRMRNSAAGLANQTKDRSLAKHLEEVVDPAILLEKIKESPEQALVFLKRLPSLKKQAQVSMEAVLTLAKSHPEVAKALVNYQKEIENSIPGTHYEKHEHIFLLIISLLKTNPEEARALFDQIPPHFVTEFFQETMDLYRTHVDTDPEYANLLFEFAESLSERSSDPNIPFMLSQLKEQEEEQGVAVATKMAKTDPQGAKDLAQKLPEFEKNWALREIAIIEAQTNPEDALATAETIGDEREKGIALLDIAVIIAKKDPKKAVELIEKNTPNNFQRTNYYLRLLDQISK
ncbi:MAG: F-box protein, partial [Chlamydiia bacterium]|nr:F-box protein [Chlamydiia bacterium]